MEAAELLAHGRAGNHQEVVKVQPSRRSPTQPLKVCYSRSSTGGWQSRQSPTFAVYADRWIASQVRLARAGLVRPNTITRFESALAAHLVPFFGAYRLDEITRERCEAFRVALFQSRGLAPRTINAVVEVLRLVLRRAILDGAMAAPDPTVGLRPLWTTPRRVDCYSAAEVARLLVSTPAVFRAMIGLAVLAGLRQGEVHALRPIDVDIAGGTVRVSLQRPHRLLSDAQRLGPPKSPAAIRDVPLRASLADLLGEHLRRYHRANPHGLLFAGKGGRPMEPSNFRRRVYLPSVDEAGLE
jgi:integrase